MDKQINSSKKVIATRVFLIGIIVIIMVLVTDFIYTKINNRPLFVIQYSDNKYSGVIYDVYVCNGNSYLEPKGRKFSCPLVDSEMGNKNTDSSKVASGDGSNISSSSSFSSSGKSSSSNSNGGKKINPSGNSSALATGIIIRDISAGECAEAIEYYYEDNNYKYYFTCIKSHNIIVSVNGVDYNIKEALNNRIVTMNDLIQAGFRPLKKSKNLVVK